MVLVRRAVCAKLTTRNYLFTPLSFAAWKQFKARGSMEILVDPSGAVAPSATLQPAKMSPDIGEMEVM